MLTGKQFILYAGLLAFPVLLTAQRTYTTPGALPGKNPDAVQAKTWVQPNEWYLRWQPLGLIDLFDMNLTLGAEHAYSADRSFALDAGYVFASVYGNENNDLQGASGFTLRVAHRWYYGSNSPWFVEPTIGMKMVRYGGDEQWVGRGVVNGVPAYEQWMKVGSKKEVVNANLRIGLRSRMDKGQRIGVEIYAGLGLRYRNYYQNIPPDAIIEEPVTWGFDPFAFGKGVTIDIPMGFRLLCRLH
ncbi:MAG TPA: hypothetical protein VK907_06695 [Phnomibacter sp.]|nr:hypothetical protein [Phnomibacter sp.]